MRANMLEVSYLEVPNSSLPDSKME